jgi:hypothetical protein
MKIVGCDLHARQQSIAMVDTKTGVLTEKVLKHEGNPAREFYATLEGPVVVGIEATGAMQWFLELLEQLGIECRAALSLGTRTADAARTGAQLSDHQPRSESSDESDQSSVSRLEHSLCRYPGLCSALSGGMVTQDRARRGTPARRAALPTVGWIADVTANPASRVIGGEPET